jgi:hypothetical protein
MFNQYDGFPVAIFAFNETHGIQFLIDDIQVYRGGSGLYN